MTEDDDSTARPVSTSKPRPPSFPSSQLPLPNLNKTSIALQSPPQSSTTDSSPNYALPTSIQTTSLATPTTNPFFGNQRDDHLHRTPNTLPSHLHQSTFSSPSSAGSLRRDRNRATRRSADVLQHLKTLDDEVKSRGGQDALAPRETKKAAITTDDVGGLVNVNQYAIIKELGRGAFAEVKLCKRQVGPMTPTPTDAAAAAGAAGAAGAGATSPTLGGGGGVGSGEYASLVSGTGSPKGGGRRGGGREASAITTSPFFSSSTSTPTMPTSRGMTPSPTPVGDTEELFAIKVRFVGAELIMFVTRSFLLTPLFLPPSLPLSPPLDFLQIPLAAAQAVRALAGRSIKRDHGPRQGAERNCNHEKTGSSPPSEFI